MDTITFIIKMWNDNRVRTKPVVKMIIIFFLLARAPARVNNDGWETPCEKLSTRLLKKRKKKERKYNGGSYVTQRIANIVVNDILACDIQRIYAINIYNKHMC